MAEVTFCYFVCLCLPQKAVFTSQLWSIVYSGTLDNLDFNTRQEEGIFLVFRTCGRTLGPPVRWVGLSRVLSSVGKCPGWEAA